MFEELDTRIAAALERAEHHRSARQRLTELELERDKRREAVTYLRADAEREEADVDRLDGIGGWWSRITGTYEERAENEAREAFVARKKLEEAEKALAHAEAELAAAHGQVLEGRAAQATLEQLLQAKAEALLQSERPARADLEALDLEIAARGELLEGLDRALDAGQRAVASLVTVRMSLNKAEEWGTVDLYRGGVAATASKHHHLGQANQRMTAAMEKLTRFYEELGLVGQAAQGHEQLGVGGAVKLLDVLGDGLLVDGWVQSRIRGASADVEGRAAEAEMLLDQVVAQRREAADELKRCERERKELIVRAQ